VVIFWELFLIPKKFFKKKIRLKFGGLLTYYPNYSGNGKWKERNLFRIIRISKAGILAWEMFIITFSNNLTGFTIFLINPGYGLIPLNLVVDTDGTLGKISTF